MMRLSSTLNKICAVVATFCMGLAYILAGYWLILLVFPAMAAFWITQRKQPVFWPASSLLVIYVLLAVVAIVLRLPVFLLGAGCTAALACWDLANFEHSVANDQPLESKVLLETHHLQSLAMAAFLGLLFIWISSSVNVRIPFGATVALVLLAVGGITYGLRFLTKHSA